MVTRSLWSEDKDAELRRLTERGYTVTRLRVVLKRSAGFLEERAKALNISLKKPQRLPYKERSFTGVEKMRPQRRRGD